MSTRSKFGKKSLDERLGVMTLASFLSSWRESEEMTQVAWDISGKPL